MSIVRHKLSVSSRVHRPLDLALTPAASLDISLHPPSAASINNLQCTTQQNTITLTASQTSSKGENKLLYLPLYLVHAKTNRNVCF